MRNPACCGSPPNTAEPRCHRPIAADKIVRHLSNMPVVPAWYRHDCPEHWQSSSPLTAASVAKPKSTCTFCKLQIWRPTCFYHAWTNARWQEPASRIPRLERRQRRYLASLMPQRLGRGYWRGPVRDAATRSARMARAEASQAVVSPSILCLMASQVLRTSSVNIAQSSMHLKSLLASSR